MAALKSVIEMWFCGNHVAAHCTGSAKLSVIEGEPTAPLIETSVGAVVSGAVAVAWRLCGAEAQFPAASW